MRRERRPRIAAIGGAFLSLAVAVVLAGAVMPPLYRDGPPPGFSGGFGEDTCFACHFSGEVNDGVGMVTMEGVPATYEPGRAYPLVVRLTRVEMNVGGFQLAVRMADGGEQAGEVRPAGPGVTVVTDRDVQYAYQTLEGSTAADGVAEWSLEWIAPAGPGPVRFDLAANAANGDDTAEGDAVYHHWVAVEAAR